MSDADRDEDIRVVSWNIARRNEPWRWLVRMAAEGAADVALLQEAGSPPGDVIDVIEYEDNVFWTRHLYDRWPLVVRLSDRVRVDPYRQVPPIGMLPDDAIGVSGIGTIAVAKVTPIAEPERAFTAVSMYARWMAPHPHTESSWSVGMPDVSAHRILSDLSAFIGHDDPARHRILAAGDLNSAYGALERRTKSLVRRERSVWQRFEALGLELVGPQYPNGRRASEPQSYLPSDTRNVPTFQSIQLDYVFASRGFHQSVTASALNDEAEWGPSDHCRVIASVALA